MNQKPEPTSVHPSTEQTTKALSKPVKPVMLLILGLLLLALGYAVNVLTQELIHGQQLDAFDDRPMLYLLDMVYYAMLVLGGICTAVASVRWAVHGHAGHPHLDRKQLMDMLNNISDRLVLSETAKRIAFRHEDLALLRKTIKDDMNKGELEAAVVLVHELRNTYGHVEEAEALDEQIHAASIAEIEAKVSTAIEHLNTVIEKKEFDRAAKEAAKIQRMYPQSERVKGLTRRVAQAREQYKHDLEREFLAAAEKDDVDRAISLLKVLDKYLTEAEAEPFRETARGVIGKQRDNLGVQFKMAVHDREWTKAVQVGEQIISEFPNTRMADEVRGMIDLLRERSAGQVAAKSRHHAPTK